MRPPDRRRPRPRRQPGNEANITITPMQSTRRAAEMVVGGALGILLAGLVVGWIDWSLGTEPATVAMAEVAR